MRYKSYLNTASSIIGSYNGAEPLSSFLKKFFAANKKYGSTDRRQITSLCYHYYRSGKALSNISIEEKICIATFLCEHSPNEFLQFHKPEWNKKITAPLEEKLLIINDQLLLNDIFPWPAELSDGIDLQQFSLSFLLQPALFVRIRPGKKDIVLHQLQEAGIAFKITDDNCIAIANSTKLDGIIEPDKTAVVQDLNSQKVLDYLVNGEWSMVNKQRSVSCWDCCAASGGKSILAYDILQGRVELAVSDIRESILSNLKKRFSRAGVTNYKSFVADLNAANCQLPTVNCQLIICDAPCTGSGTWSRTPEQLAYFKPQLINEFAAKQVQIVSNVIPGLEKGGLFFYITCSVFKKENEAIVEYIKKEFHLQLLQVELLKGYNKQADTMFTAVFKK